MRRQPGPRPRRHGGSPRGSLVDGRHILAFAAVQNGGLAAHAQDGSSGIDGGVAAADDRDPGAHGNLVLPGHRLQERQRRLMQTAIKPGAKDS